MERDKIKVGDTVKVTADPVLKGKTGIVRRIYCTNNGKPYVVNFDENFCWTFSDHEIVKVKSKKTPPCIVVYRDGILSQLRILRPEKRQVPYAVRRILLTSIQELLSRCQDSPISIWT